MWASKIIVVLLFVAAQVAQPGSSNFSGTDLEALCKGESIDLMLRKEFDSLYQQAFSSSPAVQCPAHIINGLRDLKLLLGDKDENVFTMEKAQRIKEFYYKHLDTSKRADIHQRLPESLRLFALAYLMQVSNACKRKMIEVLFRYSVVNKDKPILIDTQEEIAQFLESAGEQGDIFAPHQLGSLLPIGTIVRKLTIRVKNSALADKVRSLCEHHFKPIYEPAIMPLTVLASIGLDYKEKFVKNLLKSEHVKPEIKYWSSVTFICELMDDLDVIEGAEKEDELEILTDDDIYPSGPAAQDGSTSKSDPMKRAQNPAISVTIPNRIYDKESEELVSAMEKFQTDTYPELHIRKRFLESILPLLRSQKLQKSVRVHLSPELENIVQVYGKMDPELEAILTDIGTSSQGASRTIFGAVSSYFHRRSSVSKVSVSPLVLLIITVIIMSIVLGTTNQ